MKKSTVAGLCLAFIVPTALADRPPSPPAPYVVKGACPFECCTYRTWSVKTNTTLYSEPDRQSKPVGVVKAHEAGQGITGEVHSTPVKFIVKMPHESYKPGDFLWVYSYQGEGSFLVLKNGELASEELPFSPYDEKSGTHCQENDEYCWGVLEEKMSNPWWVKVKSTNGLEGWSDEPEHFGNKDACG